MLSSYERLHFPEVPRTCTCTKEKPRIVHSFLCFSICFFFCCFCCFSIQWHSCMVNTKQVDGLIITMILYEWMSGWEWLLNVYMCACVCVCLFTHEQGLQSMFPSMTRYMGVRFVHDTDTRIVLLYMWNLYEVVVKSNKNRRSEIKVWGPFV